MSDSVWPCALHPTKLLCPWDSPGKNKGASYHFLLQRTFLTQGWNPYLLCLLHWQVGSLTLAPGSLSPGQPLPMTGMWESQPYVLRQGNSVMLFTLQGSARVRVRQDSRAVIHLCFVSPCPASFPGSQVLPGSIPLITPLNRIALPGSDPREPCLILPSGSFLPSRETYL